MKSEEQKKYERAVYDLVTSCLGKNKRAMVGKWAKQTKNDYEGIHKAMCSGIREGKASDIGYIQAILNEGMAEKQEAEKIEFEMKISAAPHLSERDTRKWEFVCQWLLEKVGEAEYSMWWNNMRLEGSSEDGSSLLVSLPNGFTRDRLSSGLYYANLKEALNGAPIELTVRKEAA